MNGGFFRILNKNIYSDFIIKFFVILTFLFLNSFLYSQDSRLPKEPTNWLQNAVPANNGDQDLINVIFFEVPDTVTSTLYFAVNDPGNDGTTPDVGGGVGETTDFYLVGGTGCLSNPNSKLIDYSGIEAQSRTGTLLDNYTADETAAYNINGVETSEWIYFSGVSPSQGEHIGDKYYFKIVVQVSAGNFKNAYQVDISTSNTATTPTSIPGVRTFAYDWCVALLDTNTWDIYPFVSDTAAGNIVYYNFDGDNNFVGGDDEHLYAYDINNNSKAPDPALSGDNVTDSQAYLIGTQTSGTWRLNIVEDVDGPNENTTEFWFTNSATGEYLRAYSSYFKPNSPNAVALTYEDGTAVADNTDVERIYVQIVDTNGNTVPYSRDIYVTVDNSGVIDAISNGVNNGGNALITTDSDGLGYLDVRKPAPDGNVNVRAYWDGVTGGCDGFGTLSNTVIVISFQQNPVPILSSSANMTFDVGDPITNVSGITVTHQASTANITAANDIYIRIPASLDCIYDTTVTNLAGLMTLTGTGSISTTVVYEDYLSVVNNKILHIDVTGDFGSDSVLTINTGVLAFRNFNSVSAGNLELSYDGAGNYTITDDKEYIIGDFNTLSIIARETADLDNDGYIDAILLTFSDNIDDTSVVATDFLIAGSAGTGVTPAGAVDDNEIYINFTDGILLTDATPSVQFIGVNTLEDSTNSYYLGTEAGSTNADDKVGPAILSAFASDETVVAAGIDNDDTVTITWSENTNQPAINNTNIDVPLLTLNNGHSWLDGAGNITSAVWSDARTLVITLSTGTSDPDVAVGDTITIDDSLFNDGSNYSTPNTFSAITGSFNNDATPPDLSTAVTFDGDGDGYIDRIILTFDENVDETTIAAGNFSVSAGTITGVVDDGTAGNAIIWINLTDGAQLSSVTPDVTITANGIEDLSGNGNNLISAFASIDGAGPAILSAVASDETNAVAGIDNDDTVTITFSENTNQPAINNGNVDSVLVLNNSHSWLDGAGNITSAAWSSASVLVITLSTGTSDPDVAVGDTITLNGTTITDGIPNNSSTTAFSAITGTFEDTTPPDLSTAVTFDGDGDGYIDRIILTFDENVDETTIAAGNFSVSAGTITGVVDDGTAGNAIIWINLTDGAQLSSVTPDVTITANGIEDLSGNGNNLISAFASIDGAGPAILSAVASDETVQGAGIDNDDTVTITFSENTNQPAITNANIDTVLALNNSHSWLDGAGNITSAAWSSASVLVITLSTGTSDPDVAVGDTITLNGTTITDGIPNNSSTTAFSAITGTFEDTTPPDLSTAVTADNDGDGYIDRIILTFDENVDETTIAAGNFSVSAGTITGVVDDGTAGNAIIWINLTDGAQLSSVTPDVTITANGIEDLSTNGNNLISAFASTDGAGPAILSAVADDETNAIAGIDNDDTVTITFSENTNQPAITNANIDTVLALNNSHSWLDGAGNITSAAWSSASVLVITLSTGTSDPDVAVGDTITLNGTTITDGIPNNSSTTAFSAITGSFTGATLAPQIIMTRAVDGSNLVYIKFDMSVRKFGAAGDIDDTDLTYNDVSLGTLAFNGITDISPSGNPRTEYIFRVNADLLEEDIVEDNIGISANTIESDAGQPMVLGSELVSDIGVNFFDNVIMEDYIHQGRNWQIDVFDGSERILPEYIVVEATVFVDFGAYAAATPNLFYDFDNSISDANFWDPAIRTTDTMIAGVAISGSPNRYRFIIPKDTTRMRNGKVLSLVFEINGLYCYRSAYSLSDSRFSPKDAETHMVKIQSIKEQNNNVTILNNVINPGNGESTKLYYTLEKSGPVSIVVYDLKSDIVKILQQSNQSKGEYIISWDGKNENGRTVARGVYFIRIRAPGIFNQIRKVLIIK